MTHEIRRATAVLTVTQLVGWGSTFYLPAIIGRSMGRELGLSSEFVFGGVTIMLITSGLLSPLLGRRFDRLGAQPFLAVGSAIVAGGLALLATATGPATYAAAWIVVGMGTSCCLSLPSFTALAQVSGERARQSMTVLMMLTGGSSSFAWPVIAWLEAHFGWRGTCWAFAAIHLAICCPLHAFVLPRRNPAAASSMGRGGSASPASVSAEGRPVAFLAMLPAFAFSGFVGWGLSLHIVDMLEGVGMAAGLALTIASCVGILQISARVGEMVLTKRSSPLGSAVFASIILCLSFAALAYGRSSTGWAIVFIVLYSVGTGLLGVTRATLPLWAFGSAAYGTYGGRMAPVQNFAFAAAPLVFAAVTQRFGVDGGLIMSAGLGILATIFMAILGAVVRRYPA